jgi:hypothetical protein
MKYKITKQYARDLETPLAEFCECDDASFFIQRKLLSDEEKRVKLIYRLFNNQTLQETFNKEKITFSVNAAQYANGDRDLPSSLSPFKVSKENSVAHALAAFIDKEDAELFVEDKLTQASEITTYYIFNKDELITELNQRVKKQSPVQDSQGRSQTSSFRPTPLNTAPRPAGVPSAWIKDKDEDRNK